MSFRDDTHHPLEFRFRSGRLSLNFVATVGERWRTPFERLTDPERLVKWLEASELTATGLRVSAHGLARARELREAIDRAARAVLAHRTPVSRDLALINRWAARPPRAPTLKQGAVQFKASRPLEAALSEIARDAISVMSEPDRRRLRACAFSECGILFFDRSRTGRRRWCSMLRCGNRVKTRKYRQQRARQP